MSHHVTIYGALWATSKENNVINPVNGTVSQNTLLGVIRISCVNEPIFRRYHQTMSLLRSDSVCSSSKSLNRFPCRSDFSWERTQSQMAQDPVNTGHVVSYRSSSYLQLQFRFRRISCVICTINCAVHVFPLNMNLNVSTTIIFTDTQNLVALRMSFDGVTSLILPISYHDLSAISDISNIKQSTKEHQTSKERQHELVMMSFDVCKSLTPIWLFSAYQNERSGYYLFNFFQSAP